MNIDFHAHVLPGADHGSTGLEESSAQLHLAKEAGVDVVIATPHFYPQNETPEEFFERRAETAALLRSNLPEGAPRLLIGSETHLCRGLHQMERLEELCIEGTKVLLLELPPIFSVNSFMDTVEGLIDDRGLTVVMAHIDRYHPQTVDFLMNYGLLAQLNAEAFCFLRTRKAALERAMDARVVALGSDIHGTRVGYQDFDRMRSQLGTDYDVIMSRTQALLNL